MIIPAGHDYVTLPEAIEEYSSELVIYPKGNPEFEPQSYAMLLYRIPFVDLVERAAKVPEKASIVGIPTMYAIATIEGTQRLFVWPAPAQDLFARFRYCPAMKEI
jgi:hypothetical protein